MLLFIIKIYRRYFKRFVRTTCLFNPSCSFYVEDVCRSKGMLSGWKALQNRFCNCRPGYHFISLDGEGFLITTKGLAYQRHELSTPLKQEMDAALSEVTE